MSRVDYIIGLYMIALFHVQPVMLMRIYNHLSPRSNDNGMERVLFTSPITKML